MSDAAIVMKGLTKRFDHLTAVDEVSLAIPYGMVYGLLGPNGAGKTTMVRMLATVLRPTKGTALVNGFDIIMQSRKVRESLGVLPEDTGLYDRLNACETLSFYRGLQGLRGEDLENRIDELLRMLELSEQKDDRVGKYSKGMRQKLALARALIHNPPILVLDEPTGGLDVISARTIRSYVKKVAEEGRTVLLTTHNMYEAQLLCDELTIINKGRVRASGTVESLEELAKAKDLEEVFINLVKSESL